MKKVIINGQTMSEIEVNRPACGTGSVRCAFTDHQANCNHPESHSKSRIHNTFCNNPPRIFLRDDQVLEHITERLKNGG